MNSSAQVFAEGGSDLSKPLSKKKSSVVGVTEDMLDKWTSNNRSDVNDVKLKKEKVIPGILYCKYKDIPRPIPNKAKSD